MTDNTQIKNDATELLDKLQKFKQRYHIFNEKFSHGDMLEKELRLLLMIARTNEENDRQSTIDRYC